MKGLRLLLRLLLLLNFLVAFLFLLSCLAPYLNPEKFWWFGFLGLAFNVFLFANISFGIFWLLVKWKWAVWSAISLVLGSGSIGNFINFAQPKPLSEDAFSVMSYNVKTFDLYNWSQNLQSKEKMFEAILDAEPDVLCLQEFYTDNTMAFNTLKKLKDAYPYHYFQKTLTKGTNRHWGIATFSKYPITHSQSLTFDNAKHNLGIQTDILFNKDTLSIYNIHLQSIHLNPEDYTYIKQLELNNLRSIKGIGAKLKDAFQKRAVQARVIREAVDENELRSIICGDFNDSPNSYAYRVLSDGMKDTFKEAGIGVGQTYYGPISGLRIDFILTDQDVSVESHEVIAAQYSDHYPIYSRFTLE